MGGGGVQGLYYFNRECNQTIIIIITIILKSLIHNFKRRHLGGAIRNGDNK